MKKLDLNGADGREISKVAKAYEEINRRFMPPILFDVVKRYYAEGLTSGVIIRAFEITARRGAHFEYTEGILKRLLNDEITTVYQWDKKLEYKKNLEELKKSPVVFFEGKKLEGLALYMTFREELKREEDKLNEFLANPYPIDIEIPRLTDEERVEKRKQFDEMCENRRKFFN